MDPIVSALLDALDAQIALLKVQSAGVRQRLESLDRAEPPKAVESYPARCANVLPIKCALQNDEACISVGSFTDPNAWQCNGCGWKETHAGQ
jgi:hypothetical protein